jgi:hypothetical protein
MKKSSLSGKLLLILSIGLISACQTSKFKECNSISLKSSNSTVPFYTNKKIEDKNIAGKIEDKNIAGYISKKASISLADGSCKDSQKVKVNSKSKLSGNEVWLAEQNISCKK